MKVCPKCNREFQDFERVCAICGIPLIAKEETSKSQSFDMGRANAISGGVHVDSHNITNTTTIVESQKSEEQIIQENENNFMQEVQQRCVNGVITQQAMAELNLFAQRFRISAQRAEEIINLVRANSKLAGGDQCNEFLISQIIQEIQNALNANQVDILRRKFKSLEQVAKTSSDFNIQYYYNLLLATFSPEVASVSLIATNTDNYWQMFWGHVAFVKLGQLEKAESLLPVLGSFGCPKGDISLLMAIDNLAEYRKKASEGYFLVQMQNYWAQSAEVGISEQLTPVYYALKDAMLDEPAPEDWYKFYTENTLKELCAVKLPPIPQVSEIPDLPSEAVQTKAAESITPPSPDFNAQTVKLAQMQGFNPLQAAQQMGLGQMPAIGSIDFGLPSMPNINMGGMPPVPGNIPPMPSEMPPVPDIPSAIDEQLNN